MFKPGSYLMGVVKLDTSEMRTGMSGRREVKWDVRLGARSAFVGRSETVSISGSSGTVSTSRWNLRSDAISSSLRPGYANKS